MTSYLPSTARSLPIALLRARERVMGPIRSLLSDVDLTEQQWRVLRVVQENGAIDPTQIAEEACLLLPSLTRILQKLEDKGMISREQDPGDRRKQIIRLAPAGADVIAANLEASLALVAETRAKLGEDRYEALLDLLEDLNKIDL